jgi:transcriptional regulator with XRE-family HTH domain
MSLADRTDAEILVELGGRLRRYRLQQNVTQRGLAHAAGVDLRTIHNVEKGKGAQLATLVRVLRALGRLDAFDAFLPGIGLSPMELLRSGGRERQRARTGRDG